MNTNARARILTLQRDTAFTRQAEYEEGIQTMMREVLQQRETLLQEFLAQENGGEGVTPEEMPLRGYFKTFPDGVAEFVWDGNIRLRFHPPKFVDVEGTMRPVQQFERLNEPDTSMQPPVGPADENTSKCDLCLEHMECDRNAEEVAACENTPE